MHVLFVHPNFPAQFGPFAFRLAARPGCAASFASRKPGGVVNGVRCVQFQPTGGATDRNHYCARTFENAVWQTAAVRDALAAVPDLTPDVIVGHSGFGTTLFLRDLYPGVPVVNFFEYYYRVTGSDLDFRPDFPPRPVDRDRARARNATILLDLENCDLGYSPTHFQQTRLPEAYRPKVRVLFDGIDTARWRPQAAPRRVAGIDVSPGTKIVTYVSRGMESMRGFDQFLKVAKRVYTARPDTLFAVVGQDRVCYGGDERFTGGTSFKAWALAQDDYDLSKFRFTGLLPEGELARLFAVTDLHVYFTVPFVLSWSVFDAMACGAVVLASDTEPVRELIADGTTGLLAPFFDPDAFAARALDVLAEPDRFAGLKRAAADHIRTRYNLDDCFAGFLDLCAAARAAPPRSA